MASNDTQAAVDGVDVGLNLSLTAPKVEWIRLRGLS